MRKVLIFLSTILLLFALTPFTAQANFDSPMYDQSYYGLPGSIWSDMGSYSNPYPFGYWYGVDNLSGYNDSFGDWYGSENYGYYNNSFGDWYGMGDYYNPYPFGYWYGVDNMNDDYNPFGTWTGVNNMGRDYENEFFGHWYGVNNTDEFINNPMGTWYGVNNMDRDYNPFGSWSGVNNMSGDYNPFGTWSGVNNMDSQKFSNTPSGVDAYGYQTVARPRVKSYQSAVAYEEYPTMAQNTTTHFVAPRTGVSTTTALVFAGWLTLISALILKRRQVINFIRA